MFFFFSWKKKVQFLWYWLRDCITHWFTEKGFVIIRWQDKNCGCCHRNSCQEADQQTAGLKCMVMEWVFSHHLYHVSLSQFLLLFSCGCYAVSLISWISIFTILRQHIETNLFGCFVCEVEAAQNLYSSSAAGYGIQLLRWLWLQIVKLLRSEWNRTK